MKPAWRPPSRSPLRSNPSPARLLLPVLALLLLAGAPAAAQEPYRFTLSLMGGLGGSVDEDQAGLGNSSFQFGAGLLTEKRIHVGLRVGSISYDDADQLGTLSAPSLSYVTLAGEYRYPEAYYESGLFFGLGAYRLEGLLDGVPLEDTTLGFNIGVSGEFDVVKFWSLLVELSGHYVFSDVAEIFATANAGVVIRF